MSEDWIADYDIISDPAKRLAHEGDFLLWLLKIAPGKRVLDMATATGVHAQFLAKHGAEVTARDISEQAISYARTHRGAPGITYEVKDLREGVGGPFDLVIVMGNTLSLLDRESDVKAAFEAARRQIAPGGVFFVHVINYVSLEMEGPRQKVARQTSGQSEKVMIKNMVPLGEGRPALINFGKFEYDGTTWHTSGSQSVLLRLGREMLESTASQTGFEVEGLYGNYDRSAFDERHSPDLLIVMKRTPR